MEQVKENVRDISIGVSVDTLLQDLRYGLRSLSKHRGVSVVGIVTLALGIGANTAIFSIVDSFLFRPLPVRDPGKIAELSLTQKGSPVQPNFSVHDFRDIRTQSSGVFSGVSVSKRYKLILPTRSSQTLANTSRLRIRTAIRRFVPSFCTSRIGR